MNEVMRDTWLGIELLARMANKLGDRIGSELVFSCTDRSQDIHRYWL